MSALRRSLAIARVVSCLLGALFLCLALPGFFFYTSVGIDMDRPDGADRVLYRYLRLRWPGDGSIRIGSGQAHYPRGSKPIEPFDLGGTFFQPPRREPPRSLANRLGFWRVHAPDQSWVGVPGSLPAVAFFGLALTLRRGRSGAAPRTSTATPSI